MTMKTEPDPLGDEFLRPLKDPTQQDEQKTQCLNESDKLQADNLSKQLSAVSCKIVSMPIICPLCNKTFLNTTSRIACLLRKFVSPWDYLSSEAGSGTCRVRWPSQAMDCTKGWTGFVEH